jgi:ATP-binding cassette subfamily B protein
MRNEIEYNDSDTMLKPEIKGSVEFKNVSFRFDDSTIDLLEDISFSVNAGENVAIMGRTGAGKSTLVHLMNRLVDYQSGSIKIDGVELKDISKKWIRKNIGVILQEPFLYSRSVFENIGITHKNLDRNKITEAAQVACVHNDIVNFEKGYDTMIGERGVTLSGGQRQRVAIARMLIDERPILVFDDSLSAVDTETDASIRKALKVRNESTTVFIITILKLLYKLINVNHFSNCFNFFISCIKLSISNIVTNSSTKKVWTL